MRIETIIIPLILACHSQSAPARGEGSKYPSLRRAEGDMAIQKKYKVLASKTTCE
jgi:hypothetical protein